MAVIRRKSGFRPDPDSPLPPAIQKRHHVLCAATRDCYARRDESNAAGHTQMAEDFEVIGDVYLSAARALIGEHEVLTSDDPTPLYPPS